MALSDEAREAALHDVQQFCERLTPEDARDTMRLEHEASGSKITIVEHRAPWNPQLGSEWSRQPIAQLARPMLRGRDARPRLLAHVEDQVAGFGAV